jgi:hypothetical protein
MNQKINYIKNKILETKISILIFTGIGFLTLPFPYFSPRAELDSTAAVGLHEAMLRGFEFGNDVVSPFGPLQFLLLPVISDPLLWFLSMFFRLFTHFFFLYVIVLFIIKMKVNLKEYVMIILITPVVILIPYISAINDYMILIPSVILLYLISTNKIQNKYSYGALCFISFLFAIVTFIKFNSAIASLSLLGLFSITLFFNKNYKKIITILSSYFASLGFLWIISGQKIQNFPIWFMNSLDVGKGYNYAMAVDGNQIHVLFGIIGAISVICFFVYFIKKKNMNLIIFTILNGELLFQSFKHGFVRHDLHVVLFFFYYGIFFMLCYIIYSHDKKIKNIQTFKIKIPLLLLFILFVANIMILTGEVTIKEHFGKTHTYYLKILPWLTDQTSQQYEIEITKMNLKNAYQLDDFSINYLSNKTMDVMQWDLGLPWAYNFEWEPRPMWWSFMVFTPKIDKLNGDYFLDEEKAPEVIVYSHKTIDNRYPLFDEPLAFQAILKNYQYVHTSGEFALLEKNFNQHSWQKIELSTIKSEVGKIMNVPEYKEGYVFAEIELEPNMFGKIMSIAYKPTLANITFKLGDGTFSPTFRLIANTANDGVFISQYVSNLKDLTSLWSGNMIQNIDGLLITIDDPIQYEKEITVRFVGVPIDIIVKEPNLIKIPDWNNLELISGGIGTIDHIGDKKYSEEGDTIYISSDKKELLQITGWAVDNISKNGNIKTFLVFQNNHDEVEFPTKKIDRKDLVSVLGSKDYLSGGWTTMINSDELKEECYEIVLKIPRTNDQEFFEIKSDKMICLN